MYIFGEKPINEGFQAAAIMILSRAMRYNNMPTKTERTGNKPTFFVEYSGHVSTLYVRIHPNGWAAGNDAEYSYIVDLCASNDTEQKVSDTLNEIIETMDRVYNEWKEGEADAVQMGN